MFNSYTLGVIEVLSNVHLSGVLLANVSICDMIPGSEFWPAGQSLQPVPL